MSTSQHQTAEKRARLLVVEDEPALRRSLQLLLHANGFEVRAYGSGAALLADPAPLHAVCLIADYRMPDCNGVETLKALRARGWDGRAIMISGFLGDDLRRDATAAGFDIILEKPIRDQMLVNAIDRLLRVD